MLMKRIIFILLFCFTFMSFHVEERAFKTVDRTEIRDTSFLSYNELNDSILYLALVHYEVKHPKAVLAQAKLESGNFTSDHCVYGNNFLGLYNSKRRKYFKFDHWTECIEGYKSMIEYKLRDGEDYYQFLKRIKYASDPSYISKVKQIESNLEI